MIDPDVLSKKQPLGFLPTIAFWSRPGIFPFTRIAIFPALVLAPILEYIFPSFFNRQGWTFLSYLTLYFFLDYLSRGIAERYIRKRAKNRLLMLSARHEIGPTDIQPEAESLPGRMHEKNQ